ncbi:MAG: hypothetical protein V8R01_02565 [Bacilli bacterium]
MAHKYFDGIVYEPLAKTVEDDELINLAKDLKNKVETKMDELKVSEALAAIFDVYRRSNKYIDETTPWVLAKDEEQQERLKTVIYNLLEAIRTATVFLQAFLQKHLMIFKQLNTQNKTINSS